MMKNLDKKFQRLMFNLSQWTTPDESVRLYSEFVYDLLQNDRLIYSAKAVYDVPYAYGVYLKKNDLPDFSVCIEEENCNKFLQKAFKKLRVAYLHNKTMKEVQASIEKIKNH